MRKKEDRGRVLKGYTLLMAPNCQAAWETIQHTQPDLYHTSDGYP